MRAPDLIQPVVGYREWCLHGKFLLPWAMQAFGPWRPGVNRATCWHMKYPSTAARPVPNPTGRGCSCGFHAWHSAAGLQKPFGKWVAGAILAWGRIEVHDKGFRAEYAQPIAFSLPSGFVDRRAIKALAHRFGVPAVPHRKLEAFASQHGQAIPEPLYPDLARSEQAA